jgi:ribosomal protein L19
VITSGKVKRARLFYLRELQGKAARLKTAEEGGAPQ